MGLYVDRVPSSDAKTVKCNRCGGNHWYKDRLTGKSCKNRPTLSKTQDAPALVTRRAVEDAVSPQPSLQDWLREKIQAQEVKAAAPSAFEEVRFLCGRIELLERLLQTVLQSHKLVSSPVRADAIFGVDVGAQYDGEFSDFSGQTDAGGGVSVSVQTDAVVVESVDVGVQAGGGVSVSVQADIVVGGVDVGAQTDAVSVQRVDTGVQVSACASVCVQTEVSASASAIIDSDPGLSIADRVVARRPSLIMPVWRGWVPHARFQDGALFYECCLSGCSNEVCFSLQRQIQFMERGWKAPTRCASCKGNSG